MFVKSLMCVCVWLCTVYTRLHSRFVEEQHPIWWNIVVVCFQLQFVYTCVPFFISLLQRYKFTSPVLSGHYLECRCCSVRVYSTLNVRFSAKLSLSLSISFAPLYRPLPSLDFSSLHIHSVFRYRLSSVRVLFLI